MTVATESPLRTESSVVPQLLVSVRSVAEAQAAIAGGCDIVDVKEPSRGSLGRASLADITAISQAASATGRPCSAALGEVSEWARPLDEPGLKSLPLRFAKLGLSGLRGSLDWLMCWQAAMDSAERSARLSLTGGWVAVIYADFDAADSPDAEAILDAVIDGSPSFSSRFAGVLVDTFSKSSGTLLDALTADELTHIAQRTRASGRFVALAGRLNAEMLGLLADLPVDVIAIRSAACAGHDRTAGIDDRAVAAFRSDLTQAFSQSAQAESISAT